MLYIYCATVIIRYFAYSGQTGFCLLILRKNCYDYEQLRKSILEQINHYRCLVMTSNKMTAIGDVDKRIHVRSTRL